MAVNFSKQLNIIKQIAFTNGYDPQLTDNLVDKKNFILRSLSQYQRYQPQKF